MSRILDLISLDPESPARTVIQNDNGSFIIPGEVGYFNSLADLQKHLSSLKPKYMIVVPDDE